MATFYWNTRSVLRSKGSSVTYLAAYRAGERIQSTYHGRVHDWSARDGVEHKEIILPKDLAYCRDMWWALDRAKLWNHVEHHETGETPRLARKWLMHLPSELSREERRELSLAYAREVADKYRCAVDVCVHEPRPTSEGQHYHVHLLTTVREVNSRGFGATISLEVPAFQRERQGIPGTYREECERLRACWAELTNTSLERAGVPARVDPRMPQERGITPAPILKLPEKLYYHERDNGPSAAGDALRARHEALMAAYEQGPEVYARVCEEYKTKGREMCAERRQLRASEPNAPSKVPRGALTHEQLKERRREEYRVEREQLKNDPDALALERARNKQRMREWRAANRERDAENRREWERKNPQRVKAKAKKYYQSHAVEIAQRKKETYYADLEESRAKVRASYNRCKERKCAEEAQERRHEVRERFEQKGERPGELLKPPAAPGGPELSKSLSADEQQRNKAKDMQKEKESEKEQVAQEALCLGYDGFGFGD